MYALAASLGKAYEELNMCSIITACRCRVLWYDGKGAVQDDDNRYRRYKVAE